MQYVHMNNRLVHKCYSFVYIRTGEFVQTKKMVLLK